MQPNAMIQTLKALKLHGMAQAVGELASQASPAYQGAEGILDSLLKAEVAEREVRSVSYQVKVAKFPTSMRRKSERCTKGYLWRTLRMWCLLVAPALARRI